MAFGFKSRTSDTGGKTEGEKRLPFGTAPRESRMDFTRSSKSDPDTDHFDMIHSLLTELKEAVGKTSTGRAITKQSTPEKRPGRKKMVDEKNQEVLEPIRLNGKLALEYSMDNTLVPHAYLVQAV
jgi:hypothetical protein